MDAANRYTRLVEWSDKDQIFIGSCPELFYGGCHGTDPRAVFDELCEIIEEHVRDILKDGQPLPEPMANHNFVNAMQEVLKKQAANAA